MREVKSKGQHRRDGIAATPIRHMGAILLFFALSAFAFAESGTSSRALRIGYLRGDPEAQLAPAVFSALRSHLLTHPGVARALPQAGLDGVVVLASDSHQDLVQRMDAGEFDLVFASSMDYVSQSGPYEALFQLRRPRDRFDPQGERVYHSGILFVNYRHPLFREDAITPARAARALLDTDMAMVSSFSAAGYVYPVLRLASLTSDTLPVRIIFCDSPEEVVKHVVNGVYDAGACDAGVLEEVLAAAGLTDQRDALLRVVLETDPIPADPVAVRTDWLPRNSELGRELRDALRQFFTGRPDLPRLQAANDANFDDLRRNLARLRELRQ